MGGCAGLWRRGGAKGVVLGWAVTGCAGQEGLWGTMLGSERLCWAVGGCAAAIGTTQLLF